MSRRTLVVVGMLVALVLAGIVSGYASGDPDGLEKVATEQGIAEKERDHDLEESPFSGYETTGIGDSRLSGGLAGIVGVVLTFAVVGGLVLAVRRGRRSDESAHDHGAEASAEGSRR